MEKTSTFSDGLSPSPETQKPRLATLEDLPFILECGRKFHAFSPYSSTEFDEAAVTHLVTKLIEEPHGVVFVHDGGFIAGLITELFFAPSIKIAAELAWWAPKSNGSVLKQAFEDWAQHFGCSAVKLSTLNNEYAPSLARLLTEDGYTPVEVAYVKVL